jgi:hypothetical protein
MPRPVIDRPAASGDVALAGPDGRRITALIRKAEAEGTETLADIMRRALTRLLMTGYGAMTAAHLFNASETAELAAALSRTISTGDLLGRARLLEKMNKAAAGGGFHRFAEQETPLAFIPGDELPLLPPVQAIEYFRSLIPRLGVDPIQWAPLMQRSAFTLAAATERTLLDKVQSLILDRLKTGVDFGKAPKEIENLVAELGVSPKNPQYAQMVFRTNVMDSYNIGQGLAVEQDPEVRDFFPAWQYMGILDGREGDDHRPKFNRYYPSTIHFAVVRGKRVFNCRCTPNYIDRINWAELERKGARLEYALAF